MRVDDTFVEKKLVPIRVEEKKTVPIRPRTQRMRADDPT